MAWKKILLDFLNYAFLLFLISFSIIFFIVGDRFGAVYEFMKSLVPISYFGILLMVKIKLNRIQFDKRKKENDEEINLHLKYFDKFLCEIIVFATPLVILSIAILDLKVNIIDILQASAAFLLAYLSHKLIFKKNQ